MTEQPHIFSIDYKVWNALSREDVKATVEGLRELDLYHLPYDGEIVVRIFQSPYYYTESQGLVSGIPTWDHCLVTHRKERRPDFKLKKDSEVEAMADIPSIFVGKKAIHRWRSPVHRTPDSFREYYLDGLVAILASKGIEKQAKQSKCHKLGIGSKSNEYVTTIKLSADLQCGTRDEARPGMPVRPHLRRGHIRSQHYGKGNELVKKIWIEPVFVNADENFVSTRTAYKLVN